MGRDKRAINVYSAMAVIGWTALVGLSLLWNLHQARDTAYSLAHNEAVANIKKDLAFRRWANSHGGVYVPVDDATPPNPFLVVPNREIEGPSGARLTLMNPAYMLRQLQENFSGGFGVIGHITSLHPYNPHNAPDAWETQALKQMEHGQDEVAEASDVDGKPHIRVIRAMRTEKGCLKCHANQGYKEGDIRGGISASVSLEPYLTKLQTENQALLTTHCAGWGGGLFLIAFLHARAGRRQLERQQAEEGLRAQQARLEMLAHYDSLTQLPNRVLMADRLSQAIAQARRTGSLLAVGLLDLDGFKPINDNFGHALGDRLLIEVADRLKGFVRGGDTVARLGGDEFVFVFGGLDNIQECDRILNRLLTAIAAPYTLGAHTLTLSASIGVTLYPSDGADADTLVRHADHAMYVAKQAGRNRYHMFDSEQDRQAHAHREAYARIEAALANEELRLHYQPKVDMRRGKVVGFEALVRWQHPERGLLPPLEFLPVVDDSDLALPLGEWVIDAALRQMGIWRRAGLDVQVSVNIAARHLQCPEFTERLRAILADHPQDLASRLEFEVLETAALENISSVAQVITECKGLGIAFALDDFGTGYSTLSYLKRLPAKTLKIDQTFVRTMLEDVEDLAIVEGVISLTRAFQRNVVAEGVESAAHGVVLLRLGCDVAQGFGIARPMPPELVPTWLAGWAPDPSWRHADTAALRREDLPLLAMEMEHRNWVQRMIDTVTSDGTADLPPLEADACRFGRWYHGAGKERYGNLPAFRALEIPHEEVHRLGQELVRMVASGQADEAKARLGDLAQARDELLCRFDELKLAVGLLSAPADDMLVR